MQREREKEWDDILNEFKLSPKIKKTYIREKYSFQNIHIFSAYSYKIVYVVSSFCYLLKNA